MADSKREKTRFTGVYQLVSSERRHDGKPDVCWYYTLKDAQGKKVWVKVGWRSEGYSAQLAADARGKAVQRLRAGDPVGSGVEASLTLDEAWAMFDARWLSVSIKRPEDERKRYARYVRQKFGTRRMDAITLLEIEDYKASLIARGLAAASVRLILGDIRRVYRKLIEWGVYKGPDPTERLSLPKADNARTRYLTQDEARALLEDLRMRSETWHDIALMSLHTGMRLTEILHLEGQDVDFAAGTVRIRDGKTGSRTAHMTGQVRKMLAGRMPAVPTALIFTGRAGRRLVDSDASNSFARSVSVCGLNPDGIDRRNRVSFHTLRHTFCSWLAMSGVPLYVIGGLVGHSTPQMTQRYAHLCPSVAKEAALSIETISQLSAPGVHPDSPARLADDTKL